MHYMQFTLALCLIAFALYAEARVGGGYLEPVASDDPEVISLASWAANKLHGTLVKVTTAKRQVVAGLLYHLDIQMKNHNNQMKNCKIGVWIRHWMNSIRLVKAKCRSVSG